MKRKKKICQEKDGRIQEKEREEGGQDDDGSNVRGKMGEFFRSRTEERT
jgi:hypothetical protein